MRVSDPNSCYFMHESLTILEPKLLLLLPQERSPVVPTPEKTTPTEMTRTG